MTREQAIEAALRDLATKCQELSEKAAPHSATAENLAGMANDARAALAMPADPVTQAAPKMLAALQQCERFLTGRYDKSAELMVVRAALAMPSGPAPDMLAALRAIADLTRGLGDPPSFAALDEALGNVAYEAARAIAEAEGKEGRP